MIPRIESASSVEVGRLYNVPCIGWDFGRFVPVLSAPAHADPDLGVEALHLHYDLRFLTEAEIAGVVHLLSTRKLVRSGISRESAAMVVVHRAREVVRADRVCLREMPAFPSALAPWYDRLVKAYVGKKWVGDCRACPHRGTSLLGLPEVDGVVECPAHGLRLAGEGTVIG